MVKSPENKNLLSMLAPAIDFGTFNRACEMFNHSSPPDISQELETASPKYRHVLWELVEKQNNGALLQGFYDDIQIESLNQLNGSQIESFKAGLDADNVIDILQQLPGQVVSEALQSTSVERGLRIE